MNQHAASGAGRRPEQDRRSATSVASEGTSARIWALRGLTGALVVAVLAAVPAAWGELVERPVEALVWLGALIVANGFAFPAFSTRLDVSLSAPLVAASAVVFDPPLAALLNGLAFWSPRELRGGASPVMSAFNRAQIGVSAGTASVAVALVPWGLLASTVLAAFVHTAVNTLLVAVAFVLRRGEGPGAAMRQAAVPFPRFVADFAITSLLALVVIVAYESLAYWALALLVLPLWLGWSALRSARDAEDRAEELARRVRELQTLHDTAQDLLTARSADEAASVARHALRRALDSDRVDVTWEPPDASDVQRVPVRGAEPTAIVLPGDADDRELATAESVAGMLGLALVRQQLEQELGEVQRARAELAAQILEEAVRERSRLGSELHDDVLPQLAGAQMAADNARSALDAGLIEQVDRLAATAGDAVADSIQRVRQALDVIQRQIVVPGGLREELANALAELRSDTGIDGHLDWHDALESVPYAVEILLLETARGCLANVANHARAERVDIGVCADDTHVRLTVTDDGKGFDPHAVAEGHHGLALMRQRVELARGSFTIDSRPGHGARIQVEVPR